MGGAALIALMGATGCGGAADPPATSSPPAPTATAETQVTAPPTEGPAAAQGSAGEPAPVSAWTAPSGDIREAFRRLAAEVGTMTLYEPTEVPVEARLAARWWPVSSGDDPSAPESDANPRVVGTKAAPEVRVLLQVGEGWLEVIQGVRGDLGDLPGERVGAVDGHEAVAYRALGGDLVQWDFGGVWYAVYGKGLTRADVVRFALGLHPVR